MDVQFVQNVTFLSINSKNVQRYKNVLQMNIPMNSVAKLALIQLISTLFHSKPMQLETIPLQNMCLGCKRYFELNQRLPLESMTVEFKNYSFPIKESYLKQILLKTIVGFMNSKGGTIFMGVNDSTGEVEGVSLGRKQMDEFRLMIKQMLQKVQPTVDLIKSQEVSVDFVPVLEGKDQSFYGKYVIKFIVLQGDPSKLYCISEKVRVSGGRMDEVEVISSFRRHNLGGIEEIKGIKVIHQIYEKARNPYKMARTFHQNCNPLPISPMLLERPKQIKPTLIFAQEEALEMNSPKASENSGEDSQNQTIIDKINIAEKQLTPKENKFIVLKKEQYCVYVENIKPDSIKSFVNFLKNSTAAKTSQKITEENRIVKVEFAFKSQKQCFVEQFSIPSMNRLMNGFGVNSKINILNSLPQIKTSPKLQAPNKVINSINNGGIIYIILFHDYNSGTESSLQNYLQKCMTNNISRNMKRSQEGLELVFKTKKDANLFYTMCNKSPHSRQLSQFWSHGNAKLKMYTTQQKVKDVNKTPHKYVDKKQNQCKVIIEENNFPSIFDIDYKIKLQSQSKNLQSLELIASSLEPSQVSKLSNYLTNNMFYNIQKKILASKQRYYIRIVFTQSVDTDKFMEYCLLQQHKNLLAQFTSSKTLRIGVLGDSLLIYPYTEVHKEQMKKIVMKVLGQGVIKKSVVKDLNEDQKVWCLNLVDNSKLLESYQKLEAFLRKQGFFINQQWIRFKVFLDYKNLIK